MIHAIMHNDCMNRIPQIIRDLRQSRSQEELASEAGASQSLISRWEAGLVPAAADVALRLLDLSMVKRKRRPSTNQPKPQTQEL